MKKQRKPTKKQLENSTATNKIDMKKKQKKKKLRKTLAAPKKETPPQTHSDSDSDSDTEDLQISGDSDSDESESESDSEDIRNLLEPYTKDQLIDLVVSAAAADANLRARIRSSADGDASHRKIFVYGLGWDATRETLASAFEPYGEIEECNVITDRATGKAKGYGFVQFKTRQGAIKALKQPRKKIGHRMTSCQLASAGPAGAPPQDAGGRKIYVSQVPADVDPEKLKLFFAKFGEIEAGPIGFDMNTGKSRGFALFVYRNVEGARKALQEPYKVFEGNQLHCKAADGKSKGVGGGGAAAVMTAVQPVPSLAAMAQNLPLFSQNPSLNLMYGGLIGNPSPAMLGAGPVSPMMGYGAGGPHGLGTFGGNSSVLGAYGTSGSMPLGMQYAYPPSSQIGQNSSAKGPSAGGSFSGYPS